MRNDGGPAFPFVCEDHSKTQSAESGMTLRDWFAGQALIGLLAHGLANKEEIAGHAYDYADAMIAALESNGNQTPTRGA